MNLSHAVLLVLVLAAPSLAQEPPAPPVPPFPSPPPKAEPVDPGAPTDPVETIQPAIPVTPPSASPAAPLPSDKPVSFTPDQVRQIETTLKKQMMLVGMGSGVLGLLLGMMIGRKTAPRATGRRF
jgi:hypothetical protein